MPTLSNAATHHPQALLTTTRSVFGRQVKPEEFDAFKADVLKTYADSGMQINPDEIKREFCFTRKKLPIPGIGELVSFIQRTIDRKMTLCNEVAKQKNQIKDGDQITVIEHQQRLFKHGKWWSKYIKHRNNRIAELKTLCESKHSIFADESLAIPEDATHKLLRFTFDLFNISGEHRINPEKQNHRYYVTQFTLKEKPEALQS